MNTPIAPDDRYWMLQAVALSELVLYLTSPNPRVGCIIVRDGRILGSGATQAVGGPHAEIMALRDMRQRGFDAEGATVYVTLEPCSHHGRTPPCVDALIEAGPSRVVVAMLDPNPLVAGQGLARLRAAGIAVTTSVCAAESLALNPGFIARMTRKTPWVWLKLAASLDGRSALHNGVSQWITGAESRADGHQWRARSCVVLTGVGTVLSDDPQLNVRHVQTARQPIKAVVDARFEIPEDARLLDGERAWIFTCRHDAAKAARLAGRNVQVIELPAVSNSADIQPCNAAADKHDADGRAGFKTGAAWSGARDRGGRIDLRAMMQWMGAHEINEVHVEAGSRLSGALLRAGCVDELLVYMAPMLLGDARAMAQLPELHSLDQAQRFEFFDTRSLAPDVRLRARLPERWQALLAAVQAIK